MSTMSGRKNIKLDSFRTNAFYLLQLSSSASYEQVSEAMLQFANLAKLNACALRSAGNGTLCRSGAKADSNELENRLRCQKKRIKERLSAQNSWTDLDLPAEKKRRSHGNAGNLNRIHDSLIAEISHLTQSDPDFAAKRAWIKLMKELSSLLQNHAFWQYQKELELNSGFEPRASDDDFDELKQQSFDIFWRTLLTAGGAALKQHEHKKSVRIIEIVNSSELPPGIAEVFEAELARDFLKSFASLAEKIRKESAESDKAKIESLRDLCNTKLVKELEQVLLYFGKNSTTARQAQHTVADLMDDIGFRFYSLGEFIEAEKISLKAVELATASPTLGTLEHNLRVFRNAADQERAKKTTKPNESVKTVVLQPELTEFSSGSVNLQSEFSVFKPTMLQSVVLWIDRLVEKDQHNGGDGFFVGFIAFMAIMFSMLILEVKILEIFPYFKQILGLPAFALAIAAPFYALFWYEAEISVIKMQKHKHKFAFNSELSELKTILEQTAMKVLNGKPSKVSCNDDKGSFQASLCFEEELLVQGMVKRELKFNFSRSLDSGYSPVILMELLVCSPGNSFKAQKILTELKKALEPSANT